MPPMNESIHAPSKHVSVVAVCGPWSRQKIFRQSEVSQIEDEWSSWAKSDDIIIIFQLKNRYELPVPPRRHITSGGSA